MFSRKLLAIILALVTASGCSLPLHEDPPKQTEQKTDLGPGSQCLTKVLPVLEDFVSGAAKAPAVEAMWDCFGSAVDNFEKSTRGRYEDRFTAKELANFVERYFLDNQKISERLLTESFRVKQLLVGGEIDSITRAEMHLLVQTLSQLKSISVGLLPYMRVFSFNWKISGYQTLDDDVRYFEAANLQIQVAAKDLATIIEKNGQGYDINNVVVLAEEISKIADQPFGWVDTLKNVMPIVQKLKRTLSGGNEQRIEPKEWRRFALLGARGYIQYLRYFYFIKKVESVGNGPELVYIARSIDDLFSYLGDMVAGKPEGVFTRSELKEVLESLTLFMPDIHVTDRFILEVMKVKQLIFGGSLDNFTPADFERARTKVDSFRALTEKLFSYVAVYGLSWNPNEMSNDDAQIYFDASEKNLSEFGEILGQLVETQYDLNDLKVLAEELDGFYTPADQASRRSFKSVADQVVPIAIAAKNMIFTDMDSTVKKNQWVDFLSVGAGFYARYMYYHYFLNHVSITGGQGLAALGKLVTQSTDFLDSIISKKPGSPVPAIRYDELDRLVDAAQEGKLFSEKLSAKTIKNLVRIVIQKMLITPEKRLIGEPPPGITKEALEVFRGEFKIWLSNQQFLDKVFANVPPTAGVSGAKILAEIDKNPQTEALKELRMIFNTPLPMTNDDLGRLVLSRQGIDYSRGTVGKLNLSRMIVRLVIRGYAMDLKRVYSYQGVDLTEANQLFTDVKPFVVELGLLDPRNDTFADSRFREANLFVPRANGDDYLDFNEGTDLFMMLFSGVTVNNIIYDKLEKACPIDSSPTLKDDWTVSLSCLVPLYRKEIPAAFSSMPEFVAFLQKLSDDRFQEVLINLLKAAGYIPNAQNKIKIGDVGLLPHVTQYVEAIMQMFDTNHDGALDTPEAMKAYPRFRKILADLGSLKKENQIKGLFTWMLKYGKPPESIGEKLKFIAWWVPKGESGWDVSADREKFAKILGYIADATAKAAAKNKSGQNGKTLLQKGMIQIDDNIDHYVLTPEEAEQYCGSHRAAFEHPRICKHRN